MESETHADLVQAVVAAHPERTIGTRLFLRTLREALGPELALELQYAPRLQPDAFHIDAEAAEVVCWECSVTSGIERKLEPYAELWFLLDGIDWTLYLIEVPRGGGQIVGGIDLADEWYHRVLPRLGE